MIQAEAVSQVKPAEGFRIAGIELHHGGVNIADRRDLTGGIQSGSIQIGNRKYHAGGGVQIISVLNTAVVFDIQVIARYGSGVEGIFIKFIVSDGNMVPTAPDDLIDIQIDHRRIVCGTCGVQQAEAERTGAAGIGKSRVIVGDHKGIVIFHIKIKFDRKVIGNINGAQSLMGDVVAEI